ncbi:MAG TPA: alpha/beta fold hydrolase [Candidatus Didemnitutus sp.]|nr:alpha/beta fold hydrolase [Candidatus Didemnitutus sp.]
MNPVYRLLAPAVLLGALFSLPNISAATSPKLVPLESFFAEPATSMEVSPDGNYIAFMATLGYGKVGIALMDLRTGKTEALVSATDENIKGFLWKGNDIIVYWGDVGGDERPAYRSISIKPQRGDGKRVIYSLADSFREGIAEDANFANIVDPLRYDPKHVLVLGVLGYGSHTYRYLRMDTHTGERTNVAGYDEILYENSAIADNDGVLRARESLVGDQIIYEASATPGGAYVKLASFSTKDYPYDNPPWQFLHFARDNETLYFLNQSKTDTPVLQTINVRTREISAPIYQAPEGELVNVLSSYDRKKLYGAVYETDRRHYHFFDPAREALQATIDRSLPNTENTIVSTSEDEKTMVIRAASDRDPGTFYVLKNGRLGTITKSRPAIDPADMQAMEPIQFTSRDGLVIHGYLTRGRGTTGPAPLIVHPHGGPYTIRDYWGFDPEVQFLANRGFAVLQINYRGSGGYGQKFEQAGFHEWGKKMQDDLTDGVQWAITQKIADPKRVVIYGASYGGYATLAGLVYTPELYCCGINYVGPGDLALHEGTLRTHSGGADGIRLFLKQELGEDSDYLRESSPTNFIDRLRVPLLNAYGYNDARVDFTQWKRLESRLKDNHKDYQIIIQGNEGHGFRNEENRIGFYKALEAFLAKNVPTS